MTGAADKHLRIYKLSEESDGCITAEQSFDAQLDSEVNHVAFSWEEDLFAASTNNCIYIYAAKSRKLVKKLVCEQKGIPTRCVFFTFSSDQKFVLGVYCARNSETYLIRYNVALMS